MVRLSRKEAGFHVELLGDVLEHSLAALEDQAYEQLEQLWMTHGTVADANIARILGTANQQALQDAYTVALLAAFEDSLTMLREYVSLAVSASLDSLHDELAHCESTLARKHAGVAARATEAVAAQQTQLVDNAMARLADEAAASVRVSVSHARRQILASASEDEYPELLLVRLFSPDVVRLPQANRRGVWWTGLGTLKATTRTITFGEVNAARTMGMLAFNADVEG